MPIVNGTTYKDATPKAVIDALERARASGERVRLFYGDTETGRSWNEENDVSGHIGRSMGPVKVPLLVAPRAHGGPALLDHCIVAILGASGWLYRHPRLDLGVWQVEPGDMPEYPETVRCNGDIHARFRKAGQGARYIAFMTGKRIAR